MTVKQQAIKLLQSVLDVWLPRYCCVCGRRLLTGEEHTCLNCLAQLPTTKLKGKKGNVVERLLSDDVVCPRRANSYMYYLPKTDFSKLFFSFKYYAHPNIAEDYGYVMAQDLADTDFFESVDVIIPLPLSRRKLKERGYNQCDYLAKGVSRLTGLPIDCHAVERVIDNPTQTHLSAEERVTNVRGIFSVPHPDRVRSKHVLLIDDIITTGSTIRSCARVLVEAGCASISMLSLGLSTWYRGVSLPTDIHHGFR